MVVDLEIVLELPSPLAPLLDVVALVAEEEVVVMVVFSSVSYPLNR